MIYKCIEDHRELLLNFLAVDPIMNLFVIGNIETYGFDSLDQDVWAYTDDSSQITGILLRYKENVIPVHGENFDGFETFLPLLQSLDEITAVSGASSTIEQYAEFLPELELTETTIALCQDLLESPKNIDLVEPLKKIGIPAYLTFQQECFGKTTEQELPLLEAMNADTILIHVIKNDNGEILSAGRLAVETAEAGMIIDIGTIESERGNGYASAIIASLVQHCQQKGKKACLFYSDASAGRLYHRLGFQDTELKWSMLKPREEKDKKTLFEELTT
ncbi:MULTISPECIES: GNAT family N-acetyltransferase [Carnobacterium]|uniref:GNAT family N-acetyltransferase n=1 Tax=Carnobacterium antarcticum TaxID=2126436 RepID=A0ABW4NLT1_9LACT|nr:MULTISPECIES: GNAT family N-acetyltransferase [unclassified Carnobacterium]ALV21887.1 acetyltransferase, GNAT [Carnobacterium sp. CP1]QQP69863.1 GNAT family N-acetyltransferase [Carnobacterium sp. CS13]